MLVGKIHYFVEGNTLLENIIVSKFKIASIFRKIVRIPQKMRQLQKILQFSSGSKKNLFHSL